MTDSSLSTDRRLTLAALAVVVLLSALDQTIVATAMPRIIEELQGLSMYAWVTTAYLLTSTASVPIYGKLSDQYGRKPLLIFGVLLFLTGSALCGLAGEFGSLPVLGDGMMQLIVFRAVQGLGAGGLMTVSFAIMADMYPPRERGRLFGVFGSVFGLATVIGPFIGGYLTDHGATTLLGYEIAGWRWVFYVNLPLGLIALFMIAYRLPRLRKWGQSPFPDGQEMGTVPISRNVDYPGAVLVVLTATLLLLALSLGGTRYPWLSAPIAGLLLAAAVALGVFIRVESRAVNAILPLHLFRIPTFRIATLAAFVMSMAFLGVVMFMPLYMQVVQGVSATRSGVALLPLMAGMMVSSILTGRLVTRLGRYKPFMVGGGVLLFAGVVALTGIGPDTTTRDLAWRLALTGVGLGPAQTLFSLVIQNAAPPTHIGVATSMSQFSRQMGATVGVALFGTFLTHGLTSELPKHVPLLPGASAPQIDLAHAQSEAMHVDEIRTRVDAAMESRFTLLTRAYDGDAAAVSEIVGDPRMPAQIKASLADGGVRGYVHRHLLDRVAVMEQGLSAGPEGRDRLLQDPELPSMLRQQLANIPARAFNDPALMTAVAALFREALLAKEPDIAAAAVRSTLETVRAAMSVYAGQLVEQTERGVKVAFSSSIVHMLERALWIVGAALLIVLFIPELPLRASGSVGEDDFGGRTCRGRRCREGRRRGGHRREGQCRPHPREGQSREGQCRGRQSRVRRPRVVGPESGSTTQSSCSPKAYSRTPARRAASVRNSVIPAYAGTQKSACWVPAFAGMTEGRRRASNPGDSLWLVASSFFASLRTQVLALARRRSRLSRECLLANACSTRSVLPYFFLLAFFFRPPVFFFFGTFAPARRASDRPIAIACLRLVTFWPELLRSVPRLRSRMVFSTFFEAFLL